MLTPPAGFDNCVISKLRNLEFFRGSSEKVDREFDGGEEAGERSVSRRLPRKANDHRFFAEVIGDTISILERCFISELRAACSEFRALDCFYGLFRNNYESYNISRDFFLKTRSAVEL